MELFSPEFWSALITIVIIDLMLAGDNAIVIALAARNLPKQHQTKAIVWGTVGAIVIRSIATLLVVWLLKIPGLLLIGGILLLWIAYNLMVEEKDHSSIKSTNNLFQAVKTIIIADAVMGLDNVLAVAGAAHGSFYLVVLGLLISIPIVVWGSKLFITWINRFPVIIFIGAAVLVLTSGKMITGEKFIEPIAKDYPVLKWLFIIALIVIIVGLGYMKSKKKEELMDVTHAEAAVSTNDGEIASEATEAPETNETSETADSAETSEEPNNKPSEDSKS